MKDPEATAKGRVKRESRICFGIVWFERQTDAIAYDKEVRAAGITYNGGWMHGMACGRDKSWDHTDDEGVKWYAVTD